jgi:hypothetical protein
MVAYVSAGGARIETADAVVLWKLEYIRGSRKASRKS